MAAWVPGRALFLAESFVAVDFETANRAGGVSACQVALVRVERGAVTARFDSLIRPPAGFDRFEFSWLHGIFAEDVRDAPSWGDLEHAVAEFAGDLPMYAHNAPFDAGVWRDLDSYYRTFSRPTDFFCSYRTAKRIVPGLVNYKLPTVTRHLVPSFELDHHRAGSDAEACGLIVAALQAMPGAAGMLGR